jgi:predicted permease
LPLTRYPDAASQIGFYGRLLAAVRALPAVQDAGLVSSVPFSGNDGSASYIVEGAGKGSGATPHGYVQLVDAGFFQALRIPLLQGRVFDSGDSADSPRVAIVDELLVRKYFPDGHALGKRIALDYSTTDPAKTKWLTIVGVVPAIKHDTLSEQMTKETVYIDYLQQPYKQATLAMRTAIEPAALIAPLRAVLQDIDPEQPLFDIQTMDERIALSLDERRSPLLLLVLFAAIALALAAVGIYGVLAFAVALRTGEIGVRLSLGAQRRDILRLVLGDGGRLTAAGLLLGLAGAVAIAAAIRAQLFGVGVLDLPTLGFVMAIIAATALLACWLPARRAAGIDPIQALRHE